MPTVLLTAFEPYDRWGANSSWLALVHLTHNLPGKPPVTTRLYPVDFADMQRRLSEDLQANYDVALHLGQAPGSTRVRLESIGLNIGGSSKQPPEEYARLVDDGPVAYRSELPLAEWARKIQQAGIPAQISYHAGTFLCNATLYMSHYIAERQGLRTRSAFIHLPLDTSQVVGESQDWPSLPASMSAAAIGAILEELA